MAIYYSPSEQGFFHSELTSTPNDAIEITADQYNELFAAVSAGKSLTLVNNSIEIMSVPPLTISQLLAYASNKQNLILNQVWTFNVGTTSSPINLTTRLDVNGQMAAMKLVMWGQLNASNSMIEEAYSNVDYSAVQISPVQAVQFGTDAGAVVSQSYSTLNNVASQIINKSIDNESQVDSASWPSP